MLKTTQIIYPFLQFVKLNKDFTILSKPQLLQIKHKLKVK